MPLQLRGSLIEGLLALVVIVEVPQMESRKATTEKLTALLAGKMHRITVAGQNSLQKWPISGETAQGSRLPRTAKAAKRRKAGRRRPESQAVLG